MDRELKRSEETALALGVSIEAHITERMIYDLTHIISALVGSELLD